MGLNIFKPIYLIFNYFLYISSDILKLIFLLNFLLLLNLDMNFFHLNLCAFFGEVQKPEFQQLYSFCIIVIIICTVFSKLSFFKT